MQGAVFAVLEGFSQFCWGKGEPEGLAITFCCASGLGLDDTLDVLPVHGVAGLLGTLLTGVFALRVLNPAGADGLITGRIGQLWIQIQAAGFTILWVGVGTYAVLKAIAAFVPLRLTDAQERQGADIHAHGEEAYNSEFTS